MRRQGIEVAARVPLVGGADPGKIRYPWTKGDRMGHRLVETASCNLPVGDPTGPPEVPRALVTRPMDGSSRDFVLCGSGILTCLSVSG